MLWAGSGIKKSRSSPPAGAGLAARDYALVLMSPGGSAEALAEELGGIGIKGSVTGPEALEAPVGAAMEAHGRIDAVANNTGFPPKGPLL